MKCIWIDNKIFNVGSLMAIKSAWAQHERLEHFVVDLLNNLINEHDYGRALYLLFLYSLLLSLSFDITLVIISPWITDICYYHVYNPLFEILDIDKGFSLSKILNIVAQNGAKVYVITSQFRGERKDMRMSREEFLSKLSQSVKIIYSKNEIHQKIYGIRKKFFLTGSLNLTFTGILRGYSGGEFLQLTMSNKNIEVMLEELIDIKG